MKEHTPEWHQWRAAGIGGSDVAAICGPVLGFKAWASHWDLYLEKTGQCPPREDNARMNYGRMVEEAVAKAWAAANGYEFIDWQGGPVPNCPPTTPTVVWKPAPTPHATQPVFRGNPDALMFMPDGTVWVLEVKTTGVESRYQWEPEPPMHVLVQGQWYAGLLASHGHKVAGVITLCEINHDAPLEFRHHYRPGLFAKLAEISLAWWERHVARGEKPPLDGSDGCHRHLERASRRVKDSVLQATPDDEEKVAAYYAALAAAKKAEQLVDTIQAELKARMGTHEVLQCKAAKVTFKADKRGTYAFKIIPPAAK